MFNFHVIPYKRSGRAGGLSVFAAGVSAFFLVAALFLSSCTDEETVEVPGPTVTVTGPTVTATVPADINGTAGNDELSGSHIDDTINGMAGDDVIEGDNGDDVLMGGEDNDEISGGMITAHTISGAVATAVTGCDRGANATGSDGNDEIRGGAGDDKLYGGSDDDKIYGDGGNDLLCGNSGDDELYGGADDDVLDGGKGDDDIDGGEGDDMVDYSSSPMAISVDLGKSDIIQDGFFGRDTLSGIERIKGSPQADTLTGDDSDNTFMPGAGADVLDGGGGTDTLDYSDAMTTGDNPADAGITINLHPDGDGQGDPAAGDCAPSTDDNPVTKTIITVGGSGNTAAGDTIVAPHGKDKDGATTCLSSIENVTGGPAANDITGDGQANVLKGGAGNDTINGGAGNDMIYGMGGADNPLNGGDGDDTIKGGAGNDRINGGAGNDKLHGDADDNTYNGGDGDDTYYITDPDDVSDGNAGITEDDATAAGGTDTVSLEMYESEATSPTGFTLTLNTNVENVVGSKYADTLTGSGGDNEIDGGPGNDTLLGGDGDDTFIVRSGEGNDNIGSSSDKVTSDDEIVFMGFADGTTASYRAVGSGANGGFVITVGSQSIQVTTGAETGDLDEAGLKKIVEIK